MSRIPADEQTGCLKPAPQRVRLLRAAARTGTRLDPGTFAQRPRIPCTAPPDTLREAVRRRTTAHAEGPSPASTTPRPHWIT
ncbi:hypothetical protein [Streptomyces lydicus]|uniref:hypothetical protein n=1 Tax=Streptomyces lydicus TaxID=47763 RepID=UPI0013DE592C|nr:hypothetical protein [Streptomyces lydicus]